MMTPAPGELAAFTTALLWSATAVFFTVAGRQVGSAVVNRIRLLVALLLLLAAHWLLMGEPIPLAAGRERWFWLGISGVVGLVLGDAFLFQSYLWIGPQLSMLMMSLAPVLSALLALLVLGERLSGLQWLGVFVAVGGIATVILDRDRRHEDGESRRLYGRGLLLGLGAATGQAVGLVLAKMGLRGEFSALSGNLMRMAAAVLVMWGATFVFGKAGSTFRLLLSRRGSLLPIAGGSLTGPFLGVWLSLVAIQRTRVGIASTIMALPPVILLPVGYFLFKDPIGWRAVSGTLAAVAGISMLFLG